MQTAAEREENNLKQFKDFCLKNGSSQGQNLTLTVLFIPNSLDSGQLNQWWFSQPSTPTPLSGGGVDNAAGHVPEDYDHQLREAPRHGDGRPRREAPLGPGPAPHPGALAASEPRGSTSTGFERLNMKVTARIWP